VLSISERRACAALGQHRSMQRKIAALLRRAGWLVNDKRVERIWRREGLKVPARQRDCQEFE